MTSAPTTDRSSASPPVFHTASQEKHHEMDYA